MKTVYLYGRAAEKLAALSALIELEPAEQRRQYLRDLLADIDATRWCAWVNTWEPAESTESRHREPGTPLTSATPFNLQALDTLAAMTVNGRSGQAV